MDQVSRALGGETHTESPAQAFKNASDIFSTLAPQLQQYDNVCSRVNQQIAALARQIETLHTAYSQIKREKDAYSTQLAASEARLTEVQRVVQRYAIVTSPVVASDGYTYERDTIKAYLDDCKSTGTRATSQQTQTELSSVLIPNHSLKKLVDLLKTYKPPSAEATTGSKTGASGTSGSGADGTSGRGGAAAGSNANAGGNSGADGSKNGLHPCVRVYGFCNYKDNCTYAQYPYDACLSHLKGKCRFGSQCHELHVDVKRDDNNNNNNNNRQHHHNGHNNNGGHHHHAGAGHHHHGQQQPHPFQRK